MRTLKFRAWDAENKRMIKSYAIIPDWCCFYPDDNYSIMHYMGIEDKNGTDIYSDDFLRIKEKSCDTDTWHTYIRKISWEILDVFLEKRVDGNAVDLESLDELMSKISHGDAEIEVIGNAYENPEIWETT